MKRIAWPIRLLFLLATIMTLGCSSSVGSRAMIETYPEPVSYKPVQPESWTLPNGLKVLFQQDSEVPLVHGTLYFNGGTYWEDKSESGVVSAMGSQMREGGAGRYSADSLDRVLEEYAAGISSGFGSETGNVSFSCLSADVKAIFKLFADVVMQPRFERARLELWKGQALEGVQRRKDNPATMSSIAFKELLFGESPYGRVVQSSDIRAVSRVDLLRAHRKFVRPNGSILVVTGDIDRATLEKIVNKAFAGWAEVKEELPEAPAVTFKPRPGIYFIEAPFSQATIRMGHQGVPRFTDDYIAIVGFNEIFGSGGFSSRLMQRVREELGLAYGIYGGIHSDRVKGRNGIALKTKAESTVDGILESLAELEKMRTSLVSDQELENMHRSIVNSFVFRFDSPHKAVVRVAMLELLGYPADFDERYIPQLLDLTSEEIKAVANRRWQPEEFVIVVVGNGRAYTLLEETVASLSSPLKGFGLKKLSFGEAIEGVDWLDHDL